MDTSFLRAASHTLAFAQCKAFRPGITSTYSGLPHLVKWTRSFGRGSLRRILLVSNVTSEKGPDTLAPSGHRSAMTLPRRAMGRDAALRRPHTGLAVPRLFALFSQAWKSRYGKLCRIRFRRGLIPKRKSISSPSTVKNDSETNSLCQSFPRNFLKRFVTGRRNSCGGHICFCSCQIICTR